MRTVRVDRSEATHEAVALDAAAKAMEALGWNVVRSGRADAQVVWNGRNADPALPKLCIECGWLPRWGYQVGIGGINAEHHAAPYEYGTVRADREGARAYLARCKAGGNPWGWTYTAETVAPGLELPDGFLLVPIQIEADTNMRHVPKGLETVAEWVAECIRMDPPFPLVFKRHPAEHGVGVPLTGLRPQDREVGCEQASVYGLLASGRCRGVLTLNSNTAHDALLYGVPAIVLGRGIWPAETGAFYVGQPPVWGHWSRWVRGAARQKRIDEYVTFLQGEQWTLARLADPAEFGSLLARAGWRLTAEPVKARPTVQIVARNMGWLFEDLKVRFAEAADEAGVKVEAAEKATKADAYVYLRENEACESPDPRRTVVQLHHCGTIRIPKPDVARQFGAWALCHPDQAATIRPFVAGARVLLRPIGAGRSFSPREAADMTAFRVAYVGRGDKGKHVEDYARAICKAKDVRGLHAVLVGKDDLRGYHQDIVRFGIKATFIPKGDWKAFPALYRTFDALVITSTSEAGPLPLFEALASGVPVITKDCGWAKWLIRRGENGYIVTDAAEIGGAIREIQAHREDWLERRHMIAATAMGWRLEDWCIENLRLAASLAGGGK